MSDCDKLHRFIFDHSDIRGDIITLEESYQNVLAKTEYPPALQALLGQFLAAAGLLSATLKFDGILTLQAKGDGPLRLIMADCTRQHNLRAVAEFDESADFTNADLSTLIGNGQLAITIDPSKGERYQGIVPLQQPTLNGCLEEYFQQSEQLPTRIWLNADSKRAGGLLLQALPRQMEADAATNRSQWEHLTQLAETITTEEQLTLSHTEQLFRLFHQDEVRLFDPADVQFACSCSRERTARMIKSLERSDIESLLEEQGIIEVNCHFCSELYRFSPDDIGKIFDGEPPILH